MDTVDRYNDGSYLSNHPDWHVADSPFKAANVEGILTKNNVAFESAVEIGCGAGQVLAELAKRFPAANFVGCDISSEASEFWSTNLSNVRYELGSLADSDQRFDLLLMMDVFEHIPDYMGFLERHRALAQTFVFNIPLDMHVFGLLIDHQVSGRKKYGHLHYFSQSTAFATLRDCGFRVIDSVLIPGFRDAPRESSRATLRQKMIFYPRWLAYSVSPKWSAKLFGGTNLLVLAQPIC
jgi:SAM-dependent methyltransferase